MILEDPSVVVAVLAVEVAAPHHALTGLNLWEDYREDDILVVVAVAAT